MLLRRVLVVLLPSPTPTPYQSTEASVQAALDRLGSHRTVLVIAHRLGTIRNADNIVVLKDGRVAEQGTHDELLAQGGQYAEMWNMQLHSTSSSGMSLSGMEQSTLE
jgi:ABC-type multidrug transport system fused ATPase/permease subunit